MNKIPDPYLADILDSISLIEKYLGDIDLNKEKFFDDTEKQDSVIRRLEIIGEATKRLEEDFKTKYSDIPWRRMAGMRDVLIHEYDEVDLEQVWNVIINDLPLLKVSIAAISSVDAN